MYPDRYPAAVCSKGGIVPAVDPLKFSPLRIKQFHSETAIRGEGNGRPPVKLLLSVTTYVQFLRHHHSRGNRVVWNILGRGWIIGCRYCAAVPLKIYQEALKMRGTSAHVNGDHASGRMHGETPNVERMRVYLSGIDVMESSGVFGVFQNLGLTMEIVHDLLGQTKG